MPAAWRVVCSNTQPARRSKKLVFLNQKPVVLGSSSVSKR
jgi:hypothetical protein